MKEDLKCSGSPPTTGIFSSCNNNKYIYILLREKLTIFFFLFIVVAIQHKTILTQQFSLPEGDLKLEIFKHVSNHL